MKAKKNRTFGAQASIRPSAGAPEPVMTLRSMMLATMSIRSPHTLTDNGIIPSFGVSISIPVPPNLLLVGEFTTKSCLYRKNPNNAFARSPD